jgi:uncharacterized protein YaaQ
MKMIYAVVQDTDADAAMDALVKAGHRVTRVASTGGFFRQGNTSFICGVEDQDVDSVVDVLRKICERRTRLLPVNADLVEPMSVVGGYVEVPVGGATIFVFNIERFEQI